MPKLKQQIQDTLIRVDGKLNSVKLGKDCFKQSDLFQQIMDVTSNMAPDSKISERIYRVMNDIESTPMCIVCGNDSTFSPSAGVGYTKTCASSSCKTISSTPKRLETTRSRYGSGASPHAISKARARADQLQIKGRATLLANYGVTNPGQMESHREKTQNTLMERYGVASPSHIPHVIADKNATRLNSWASLTDMVQVVEVEKRTDDGRNLLTIVHQCTSCESQEESLGETFKWRVSQGISPCSKCSGIRSGSAAQLKLYEYICELVGDENVIYNDRSILPNRKELDVYVPSARVAIEYNGVFWHSYTERETKEQRNSHLTKTVECEQLGIHLIHVFENEWINTPEIVKSRISNTLGTTVAKIGARKCSIVDVSPKEAKAFFTRNHIQSQVNAGVTYGLSYRGNLVACMSFGKARFSSYQWEMLRFSTEAGTSIPGGASKLFNHFINNQSPTSVVSYADRRWSNIDKVFYTKIGFELSHASDPNYYYYKQSHGMKLMSRVQFQKHKLPSLLDTFDISLTEAENMFANGYRRIWDCGNFVFVWKAPNHT